jgi:hypothetical protein
MFRLRPVAEALLTAETSPEKALSVTQSALDETPEDLSLLLLQAWLKPEQYLRIYINQSKGFKSQDTQTVLNYMKDYRNPRRWVRSLESNSVTRRVKGGLVYVYRNYDVVLISSIPAPPDLRYYHLVKKLNLFTEYSARLVSLESLVQEIYLQNLYSATDSR